MNVSKLILVVALGSFATGEAVAATTTTTMGVSASVSSACSVTAAALAFGTYDPASGTVKTGTGTVTVTCTLLAPYNIGISAGTTSGATVSARKMDNSGNTLNYSLCRDVACTLNWGTTVNTDTLAGVGTGLAVPTTVYGQIPAGQNAATGSFSDTVTITVTY